MDKTKTHTVTINYEMKDLTVMVISINTNKMNKSPLIFKENSNQLNNCYNSIHYNFLLVINNYLKKKHFY
jgi:hypothetical protein